MKMLFAVCCFTTFICVFIKEEPVMLYATADTNPFIPINNLSTAHKHYRTCTNLCSTIKDTLETLYNLSTV